MKREMSALRRLLVLLVAVSAFAGVITFGMDQSPWVSMTVMPTHDEPDPVEIMSVNFL
ncbi:MAG: hypothetical protein HGJ94_03425 [Desulfosarcina sp.]|nr:hypothetical protein [Desulfosarcina sp.]MBC2742417.1 hypothetical protein [Desulfosarcina sp.]MBC2765327.1 hypothetical protein [Desulfosarcina sp.]